MAEDSTKKKGKKNVHTKTKKSQSRVGRLIAGAVAVTLAGTIAGTAYLGGDNAKTAISSNISQYWDDTTKKARRALSKNPGDLMYEVLELKKEVEELKREYRAEFEAGSVDTVVNTTIDNLEEIGRSLRSGLSSPGNAERAYNKILNAQIHIRSIDNLITAQEEAQVLIPQVEANRQKYAAVIKQAKEFNKNSGQNLTPEEKEAQAGVFAEALDDIAVQSETILRVYLLQETARHVLKEQLEKGSEAGEYIEEFKLALRVHAPYISREDLQTKVLEPTIAQLEAFYSEQVIHDKAVASLYKTLRGMSKLEAYDLRKEVDAKLDPASRTRLFMDDVATVKRMPLPTRRQGAYLLIDGVSDVTPEEAAGVAVYALQKVQPEAVVTIFTSRLDSLAPLEQIQAHAQLGELYAQLSAKVAQYQSPNINTAGFPLDLPGSPAPVDQEDRPQQYVPSTTPSQQSVTPRQRTQKQRRQRDDRGFFEKLYDRVAN